MIDKRVAVSILLMSCHQESCGDGRGMQSFGIYVDWIAPMRCRL
jgi:hypothetical protein